MGRNEEIVGQKGSNEQKMIKGLEKTKAEDREANENKEVVEKDRKSQLISSFK